MQYKAMYIVLYHLSRKECFDNFLQDGPWHGQCGRDLDRGADLEKICEYDLNSGLYGDAQANV